MRCRPRRTRARSMGLRTRESSRVRFEARAGKEETVYHRR
jgi:hypothetical protein